MASDNSFIRPPIFFARSAVVLSALTGQDMVTAGHVSHCHACKNHRFARERIKSCEFMKPLLSYLFLLM